MSRCLIVALLILCRAVAESQSIDSSLGGEANYRLVDSIKIKEDKGIYFTRFILVYQLAIDSAYQLKKYYRDSTRSLLYHTEFFYRGLRHGKSIHFSGKRFAVENWAFGKREGLTIDYYEAEKPYIIAYFKNGYEEGVWQYFTPEGILFEQLLYKKGKLIKEKRYD